MLTGIDISHYEKGFDLASVKPGFCIVKATEGTGYVDNCCDGFITQCKKLGIPWGYYHFARTNGGAREARFFYNQTKNYVGKGIPVLDFEDTRNSSSYIDEFVKEYHAITRVYPWVYMSSDFINNRGYGSDYVKNNCGLWLAGYPSRTTTYPAVKTCPYKHRGWTLAAWQFTNALSIGGMSVDGDVFYGDTSAWNLYATGGNDKNDTTNNSAKVQGDKWDIARQVINGAFGNGDARRDRLGDRYNEIQACVNVLVGESDIELANRVINGEFGNGDYRKYILGDRYNAVQKQVNRMV